MRVFLIWCNKWLWFRYRFRYRFWCLNTLGTNIIVTTLATVIVSLTTREKLLTKVTSKPVFSTFSERVFIFTK